MNDIGGYLLLGLVLYWIIQPSRRAKKLQAEIDTLKSHNLAAIVLDYVTCVHEDGPEQYVRNKYGDIGIRRLRASGSLWRTAVNLRRSQVLGSTARAVYRSNRRQADVGIHTLVLAMRETYRTTINGELGAPPMTEEDEILAGLSLLVEQAEIDTMEDVEVLERDDASDDGLLTSEQSDEFIRRLLDDDDDEGEEVEEDEPNTGTVPTRKGRRLR